MSGQEPEVLTQVELRELWKVVWDGKWLMVGIIAIFAVTSVFYAKSIPDEYRSVAILSPASVSNSSSLSRLAGQYGGLASLAGVNLAGGESGDKTLVAMELIKTWGFLENFIADNNLEIEVFAVKGWDRRSNKLLIDSDLYDEVSAKWVRAVDPDTGSEPKPSGWELYSEIKNRIQISQSKQSGLISLSVDHYSPVVAKKWVDLLIVVINKHIQLKDKKEALNSISYLKEQVNKTSLAGMQTIFYQLIEEQAKTLMLAEISTEYVFKTLSPAKIAVVKSKPKRLLIVGLGVMFGGILAVFAVLIFDWSRGVIVRKT